MGDRVSVGSKDSVRTRKNYSKQIVGGNWKGNKVVLGTVKEQEKQDHEFCLRCGRKLKNPIARAKGYGAVCERKLLIESDKNRLFSV